MRSCLLALLLAPAIAAADGGPRGWTLDETDSVRLTVKAQEQAYFGGVAAAAGVQAWRAPDGRASFWITRVQTTAAPPDRDAAASAQIAELAATAQRNGGQIDASAQRWDDANKFLEATIAWRNPELGVQQRARTMVVADATALHAVMGECVLPLDVAPATAQACEAALAALQPLVEQVDQRQALALVAPPTSPPPPPAGSDEPAAPATPGPRMDAVPRTGIPPMTISSAPRERDRRPVYLGLGVIVLAAAFWWNRRRRERFERDEPDEPDERPAPRRRTDDDADDLHAAARGDAPKDES